MPGRSRREGKRPRRRKVEESDSEEEEDGDGSSFPTWKTCLVVAVIVGCFAILYPKMFHPMLMMVLGMNKKEQGTQQEPQFPHPPMRGGPAPGRHSFGPDPHVHAGPHPGMHMAGQQQTGAKGSKGMWHWMLPFYTVGVIVFLLYTLSKILWRNPKPDPRHKYNMRYNATKEKFEVGDQSNSSSEEEESEDERLSLRGKLSHKEMKGLQKRLNETESAMHKILGQLETLSSSVNQETAENMKKMTMETLTNLAQVEAMAENVGKKTAKKPKNRKDGEYLDDLERALTEFKQFTENYIQEHSAKLEEAGHSKDAEESKAKEDSVISEDLDAEDEQPLSEIPAGEEEEEAEAEEEEGEDQNDSEDSEKEISESVEERGFDKMESEDTSNLILPEGEGELIQVPMEEQEEQDRKPRQRRRRRKD